MESNKRIWIFNHYATSMYIKEGGRHYSIAKELIKLGIKPVIFCANTLHNSDNKIDLNNEKYITKEKEGIEFIFVKTNSYSDNGFERIRNMYGFYKNIFSVTKDYLKNGSKPDIILASSVHPLTLIAGEKIAKSLDVPCICEIRDLWPESLIEYGYINRYSILSRILFRKERSIYKKADALIFTMAGGKKYVYDKNWDNVINVNKIFNINNGVDIENFDYNKNKNIYNDKDLDSDKNFKVIYTGSIRPVNNIDFILETAKLLKKKNDKIKFIIYGSGIDLEKLCKIAADERIDNVIFKGKVEKKYIPSILVRSDVNLLHNRSTGLNRYGGSQNKMFEYLASGKPILQTFESDFSIIKEGNCGYVLNEQTPEALSEQLLFIYNNQNALTQLGENARKTSLLYDYKVHSNKLKEIIENIDR